MVWFRQAVCTMLQLLTLLVLLCSDALVCHEQEFLMLVVMQV